MRLGSFRDLLATRRLRAALLLSVDRLGFKDVPQRVLKRHVDLERFVFAPGHGLSQANEEPEQLHGPKELKDGTCVSAVEHADSVRLRFVKR